MAIQVEATQLQWNAAGTSCPGVAPAGVLSTDLLVAHIIYKYGLAFAASVPAGWTLAGQWLGTGTGPGCSGAVYIKPGAPADSGATFTWTVNIGSYAGTVNSSGVEIFRVSGVDLANPVNAVQSETGPSGTDLVVDSITTTVPNTLVMLFESFGASALLPAPVGGNMANVYNDGIFSGGNRAMRLDAETQAAAGATGSRTIPAGTGSGWGTLMALAPTAPADTTPPAAPTGLTVDYIT